MYTLARPPSSPVLPASHAQLVPSSKQARADIASHVKEPDPATMILKSLLICQMSSMACSLNRAIYKHSKDGLLVSWSCLLTMLSSLYARANGRYNQSARDIAISAIQRHYGQGITHTCYINTASTSNEASEMAHTARTSSLARMDAAPA